MTGDALRLADVESVHDLATFVGRARRLDPDGAVRLQCSGSVLAAWVCVLPGQGLSRTGLVLGLRTMPLERRQDLDVTVPLGGMTDRFARRVATGDVGTTVPVPPTTVAPAWAVVSPPRGGWTAAGDVSWAALERAARAGVTAVAEATPEGAGAHAVAELRHRVWQLPVPSLTGAAGPVPSGMAFAAEGLGFGRAGASATVWRSGPWTRLTLPAGHVLSR